MSNIKFSYERPVNLYGGFEMVDLGDYCQYGCFGKHGRCPTVSEMEEQNVDEFVGKVRSILRRNPKAKIALDAPSFTQVPNYSLLMDKMTTAGLNPYLRVEDTVHAFVGQDLAFFKQLRRWGIGEIWMGIESGSAKLRDLYGKPPFSNEELEEVHMKLRRTRIKGCWYVLVGLDDDQKSITTTSSLIRKIRPNDVWIGDVMRYEDGKIKFRELRGELDRIITLRDFLEKTVEESCGRTFPRV